MTATQATAGRPVSAGKIEGPREETSLLGFLSVVLMHRRLVAVCALLGTLIFGIAAASEVNFYEARASFIVKGSRAPVQLPGSAAALGLLLSASADLSQSIVFYADLARANTILRAVASKQYATSDQPNQKRSLASIYGIEEKNPETAAGLAARRLGDHMSTNIYSRSGVVAVSVKSTDPFVAQQLVASVLTELEAFSTKQRQSQAVEERLFVQGLVGEARAKLTQTEEALRGFHRANSEYYNSPQLRLEYDRLTRDVQQQQQIYTALAHSFEQARIDEVRDNSPLNIVEVADLPATPQRKAALRKTLLGLSVGLFAGIVLAFVRQRFLESRAAHTPGYSAFSAVIGDSVLPPLLRPR